MDWRAYQKWWMAYDAGGLAADQSPPDALVEAVRASDIILASPLPRSLETARAVAEGREIVTDIVFVEAPLPPPPIPGLKLRPGAWGVLARISWWFGFSRGLESRREAEDRADAAVDRILRAVGDGRTVVVCAHGWFNRMLRPVLLARGWRCEMDGRDGYWSFRRFVPGG